MWHKECAIYFGFLLLAVGCLALPNGIINPKDLQTVEEVKNDNETAPCVPRIDPNLCTKNVEVNEESVEYVAFKNLKNAFEELNIKMPTELLFDPKTKTVCCEGYDRQSVDELCQPLCSPKCERNSFCSKPNVCECANGYENLNGTCHRLCESSCGEGSYCRDGKYCDCKEGYDLVGGDCLTKDEILKEKEIVDPNLCTKKVEVEIKSGIPQSWLQMKNEFEELQLPFPSDLFSSTRIEIRKFCCEGYEKRDGQPLCQPVCPADCGVHSFCGESGFCECEFNYQVATNGTCIKNPEEYQANDQHVCKTKRTVSYVDRSSLDSLLTTPQAARSLMRSKVEVQLTCCLGYAQNVMGSTCQPMHIDVPCIDGYQKSEFGQCEPICTADCQAHSSCIRPETCQCDVGYYNSTSLDNKVSCRAICLKDIPDYSVCVRPDEWECESGYVKLPTADGKDFYCAPHCEKGCFTFAKCVAPEVCKCQAGYTISTMEFRANDYRDICVRIDEGIDDLETETTPLDIESFPELEFRSANH